MNALRKLTKTPYGKLCLCIGLTGGLILANTIYKEGEDGHILSPLRKTVDEIELIDQSTDLILNTFFHPQNLSEINPDNSIVENNENPDIESDV